MRTLYTIMYNEYHDKKTSPQRKEYIRELLRNRVISFECPTLNINRSRNMNKNNK